MIINQVFTILFTFEVSVRIIAHGLWQNQIFHVDPYLWSGWNWLDLIIVITSLIDLITKILQIKSSNLGAIKALRSLRALRPLRVIKSQPKLKQVVNAFFSSVIAIKNILFIGALLILIFSIIGVSLFKGMYY
jgi:voltage-dependent calcium channel L type alpha-1D